MGIVHCHPEANYCANERNLAQLNPRTILSRFSCSVVLQKANAGAPPKNPEQKRQKIELEAVMIVVGCLLGTRDHLANYSLKKYCRQ